MASDGQPIERLRAYLQTLRPRTRATLLAHLERALLRGEEVAGGELVLAELRRAIRAAARPAPRIGDAARLFFTPLEPFLIDGPATHQRLARLARASLEPIWVWLGRDLIPDETAALADGINRALLAGERSKAEKLVQALHERAIQRIRDTLAGVADDEKAQRRLGVEVGTPRAVEDLTILADVLSIRGLLADLARRLPDHIRTLDREHVDDVKAALDAVMLQKTAGAEVAHNAAMMPYGLIMVMNRLVAPWQLVRLAAAAAESDAAARIAGTPYGVAVALVLNEAEHMIGDLRAELKTGEAIASTLKGIHDAARELRSEIDLSVDSVCSRQLAALSSEIARLLGATIEATPGQVRRLLRPRPAREVGYKPQLDAIDVDEAEMRLEIVGACRHYAAELAISEVTQRTYSELSQYLETATRILLDALRHGSDDERPFRQSQVDAAIRFSRSVFGAEHAALLAKAAEVALLAAAQDSAQASTHDPTHASAFTPKPPPAPVSA